jgi:hypothetical protein
MAFVSYQVIYTLAYVAFVSIRLPGRIRRFFRRAGTSLGCLPLLLVEPTEDRRDRPTTALDAAELAPDCRRCPLCLYRTIVPNNAPSVSSVECR